MAHISVSPQTANLKDGEKERFIIDQLEEGEIEDGELPEDARGGISRASAPVQKKSEKDAQEEKEVKDTKPASSNKTKPQEKVEKTNITVSARLGIKKRTGHHHSHQQHVAEQNKEASEAEDEWAGVVEKAIKAAMNKEYITPKSEAQDNTNDKPSQDEEKKYKRKKRKKKHREEDDEDVRKESKRRKRNHQWEQEEAMEEVLEERDEEEEDDEDDDDDDEMLFVRGASPIMKGAYLGDESPQSSSFLDNPYSFSEQGLAYDDPYDSFNDEESDYDNHDDFLRASMCDDDVPKRGMGRGSKRRQRGVGRGVLNKRLGRKENKKGRGATKRQQMRVNQERGADSLCMFFMQGKCQKGDDCPYSHDGQPPRKMELCKFYLMDCCAKKDKCLYMHHDFPCKFHHTGLKCFAGSRCKFSHGHLSDTLRAILLKHLETAPKEILGDFPRLSREGAAAMVFNKKNRGNKANKKIPSLFDIEVPIPAQLLAEQKEGGDDQSPSRRTPMPESDNEEQERSTTPMPMSPKQETSKNNRWSNDGTSFSHSSTHSRDFKEEYEPDRKGKVPLFERDFNEQLDEFKPLLRYYQETLSSDEGEKRKEESVKKETRSKRELNLHRLAGYSPNPTNADDGKQKKLPIVEDPPKVLSIEVNEAIKRFREAAGVKEEKPHTETTNDSQRDSQADTGDSGNESNDGTNIPLHLPKKQRELFLRIQQQQREAESSQDQSGDNEEDDEDNLQEENWYSSDEEDESLTNVLKNLSQQDKKDSHSKPTTTTESDTSVTTSTTTSTGNFSKLKLPDLSHIDISESVSKLLSSIRNQQNKDDGTTVPKTPAATDRTTPPHQGNPKVARDPRLSRDPRNRSGSTPVPLETVLPAFAANTTTTASSLTTSSGLSVSSPCSQESSARRSDPRRANDPRSSKSSHRSETSDQRHHGAPVSSRRSSGSSTFTSIYSNAITSTGNSDSSSSLSARLGLNVIGQKGGSSEFDLRTLLTKKDLDNSDEDVNQDSNSNLDFRLAPRTSFLYGDMDLRHRSHNLIPSGQTESGKGDVDFRRVLDLPFKPVPMHTPATEIDASVNSHPLIPYKLVLVTIPRPNYTNLKVNTSDPQVHSDPRLRKIFKLSSPLPSPTKITSSLSSAPRNDPRRQTVRSSSSGSIGAGGGGSGSFHGSPNLVNPELRDSSLNIHMSEFSAPKKQTENFVHPPVGSGMLPNLQLPQNPIATNFDPRITRNPRHGPGLLGPAPIPVSYCPKTPLFEDQDDNSNGSDSDQRMYYGRGNSMDMPGWEQQNVQQPHQHHQHSQRSSWRGGRRTQQQRYMEQDFNQRSYTPPI